MNRSTNYLALLAALAAGAILPTALKAQNILFTEGVADLTFF
jgi:hypothetical protein